MAKQSKGGFTVPVYKCRFCDKEYKREESVTTHKCLKRDRYNDRESRHMREAYRLYVEFMNFHHLAMKKSEEPLMAFIKSKYFNDFFEFAEYILDSEILNKDKFVTEILTSGKPVYEWRTHKTLEEWVLKNIREEHPRRAIERSIMALDEWGTATENDWWTFFDNASTERAIMWFEMGKVSPWLIYVANPTSGNRLLNRMSDTELSYLFKFIDPTYYQIKTIQYQSEVQELRALLTEFNL